MTRKYFGTDGIRGRANGVITAELALKVGQAVGLIFQNGEHRHRVLIGKDTRLSGYMIENALTAGFTSVGMDVLLTGPIPTPGVAMLTRSMRADLGVMISASHNPFDDNGIKLFGPDGYKLSDEIEKQIEELIDSDLGKRLANVARRSAAPSASTACRTATSNSPSARCRARMELDGMRVVVDCANGAAYRVAPAALWELGAEVFTLGVEPDGFNINKDCGSTAPEALARKVREMRADIGIALDGDADRVVIVDEKGHLVDGDQLLAVVAESWKEDGRLAKPTVVATVMSNLGFERHLKGLGLDARAHAGRRPLRARAHARGRLQSRRRAVRPHHHVGLCDHRRRLRRGAAGAGGGEEARPAGVGGVPPLRSAAAGDEERALPRRQAARGRQGEVGDRGAPCSGSTGRAA